MQIVGVLRATGVIACGHCQMLQFFKWLNWTHRGKTELKIKGIPRSRKAEYTEARENLWVTNA
jgi:hypothetical protein